MNLINLLPDGVLTSLLKDPDFDNYFKREWAFFLEMNDAPGSCPSLQEKQYYEGEESHTPFTNKKNKKQKLKQLQDININNPTEETQNKLRE